MKRDLINEENNRPNTLVIPAKGDPDNCFCCPHCGGVHFIISNSGVLSCTSKILSETGCGWKAKIEIKEAV